MSHQTRFKGSAKKVVVAVLLVFFSFLVLRGFELREKILELEHWMASLGPWGSVVYFVVYVLGVVAFVSAPLLTAMGGVLFGPFWGVLLVSLSSTVAVTVCFFLARYVARQPIQRFLSKFEKFQEIDHLIETQGALVVAFARLVPVLPFPVINYGFGLTGVKASTYIFWSWLCMLPGTVVYVVGIASIKEALKEGRIPWGLVAVLAMSVVVFFGLIKVARRKLRRKGSKS